MSLTLETNGQGQAILAEWNRGRLQWLHGRAVRYAADDMAFSIFDHNTDLLLGTICWAEIETITAYRRELISYDMLCLGCRLADGSVIELWEESSGFAGVLAQMAKLFGDVPDTWYEQTTTSASVVLFRRGVETG